MPWIPAYPDNSGSFTFLADNYQVYNFLEKVNLHNIKILFLTDVFTLIMHRLSIVRHLDASCKEKRDNVFAFWLFLRGFNEHFPGIILLTKIMPIRIHRDCIVAFHHLQASDYTVTIFVIVP